jgi:hypothetical protein
MKGYAEAARFHDKYMDSALAKIDDGVKDLQLKYPGMKKPIIE